ncbi:hypothetical protein KC887_00325 [Candidatus Kaiserbacteria bacterium]|nr:hypothetical protein [Candidatus Kaiserbacteria bacterium]
MLFNQNLLRMPNGATIDPLAPPRRGTLASDLKPQFVPGMIPPDKMRNSQGTGGGWGVSTGAQSYWNIANPGAPAKREPEIFGPYSGGGGGGGFANGSPAAGQGWQPYTPPSATRPVDLSAALAGYLGNAGSGGGGGSGGQFVHNPQPNYFPSYHNSGIGFGGGTGWAGTSVGGYSPGSGSGQTQFTQQTGFVGTGDPGFGNINWKNQMKASGQSPLGALVSEYQRAQNDAVQANEQRYQNILAGYNDRWQRAMSELANVGNQQRADLNRGYDAMAGQINANSIDRGLSNSTVRDTMLMGNQRERSMASNRLEEALTRERLGYDTGLQGDLLQFMERRNDTYPQLGQLTDLARMLGMATPSGGGGGGGLASIPIGNNAPAGNRGGNPFLPVPMPNNMQFPGNAFQQQARIDNMGAAYQFYDPSSPLTAYQQKILYENTLGN